MAKASKATAAEHVEGEGFEGHYTGLGPGTTRRVPRATRPMPT